MRIAFTGGGTGGHIYPCLAVAELFDKENQDFGLCENSVYYIGCAGKLEEELCQRKGYIQFLPIDAPRLPSLKASLGENLKWFSVFYRAFSLSRDYLRKQRIDVVMGTGGYVAAPVFLACLLTRTKFLIHNLDGNFGLVNKLFLKFANRVTLGFPLEVYINEKSHYTGNPVSGDFIKIYEALNLHGDSKKENDDLRVLISGGSQGSQYINDTVGALLEKFEAFNVESALSGKRKVLITHITGPKLFAEYVNHYLSGDADKYPNYKVLSYTHEMPRLCEDADIAICRSGAMTCAEMAMSQIVPIFIPLPWAANDHQTKNAEALVHAGCGFLVRQGQGDGQTEQSEIFDLILGLVENPALLIEMRKKLLNFAKPNSSKEIFDLLKKLSP